MLAKNLQPILQELHKAFNKLNETFYENQLPNAIIAIHSQGKRKGVNGWFTPSKVWTNGEEEKHEICITAETLNRNYMDIMRTLHHEMIHLYCHVNKIKDTSRSGAYHNKEFKKACLEHGFYYPEEQPDKKIGWSFAELTPETIEIIKNFGIRENVFDLVRKSEPEGTGTKKKSNIIKWECSCGDIIRSSKKDIVAICGKCETKFEEVE